MCKEKIVILPDDMVDDAAMEDGDTAFLLPNPWQSQHM